MRYFPVRYDSRVVIYDRIGFIRLATGGCRKWLLFPNRSTNTPPSHFFAVKLYRLIGPKTRDQEDSFLKKLEARHSLTFCVARNSPNPNLKSTSKSNFLQNASASDGLGLGLLFGRSEGCTMASTRTSRYMRGRKASLAFILPKQFCNFWNFIQLNHCYWWSLY